MGAKRRRVRVGVGSIETVPLPASRPADAVGLKVPPDNVAAMLLDFWVVTVLGTRRRRVRVVVDWVWVGVGSADTVVLPSLRPVGLPVPPDNVTAMLLDLGAVAVGTEC